MIVSAVLAVVQTFSAVMLAALVIRHKRELGLHVWVRMCLSAMAMGLMVHVNTHIALLFDWRPPRTWTWLAVVAPLNATIWVAFITDMTRVARSGPRQRPAR